jgi:hypothetical protein
MTKIAILQPNYIPWKGVFDLINKVDVFVFYDDVQYTVKDWRNRNVIKTQNGTKWLSVPVIHKGRRDQLICEALINNTEDWQMNHYKTIKFSYAKAKYFDQYHYILEDIYLNNKWNKIADLDIFTTKIIAEALGINVEWAKSSDLNFDGNKDGEKVLKICKHFNADYFINGPSSKQFMNEKLFNENDVQLSYMEYNYEEYNQLYPPFNHFVSVLDTLFNCGPEAKKYILNV